MVNWVGILIISIDAFYDDCRRNLPGKLVYMWGRMMWSLYYLPFVNVYLQEYCISSSKTADGRMEKEKRGRRTRCVIYGNCMRSIDLTPKTSVVLSSAKWAMTRRDDQSFMRTSRRPAHTAPQLMTPWVTPSTLLRTPSAPWDQGCPPGSSSWTAQVTKWRTLKSACACEDVPAWKQSRL